MREALLTVARGSTEGANEEGVGRNAAAAAGRRKMLIVESSASRSSAPQLRMEQEPERGQHIIPAFPPAQQSMPVSDAAAANGA